MRASYLAGPAALADLAETAAVEGGSVIDYFKAIRTILMSHLVNATEGGDPRAAAAVANSLTAVLERLGKITGELSSLANNHLTVNLNLLESPQFGRVQAAILKALAGHSAARADVIRALRELDQDQPVQAAPRAPLIEAVAHVG